DLMDAVSVAYSNEPIGPNRNDMATSLFRIMPDAYSRASGNPYGAVGVIENRDPTGSSVFSAVWLSQANTLAGNVTLVITSLDAPKFRQSTLLIDPTKESLDRREFTSSISMRGLPAGRYQLQLSAPLLQSDGTEQEWKSEPLQVTIPPAPK